MRGTGEKGAPAQAGERSGFVNRCPGAAGGGGFCEAGAGAGTSVAAKVFVHRERRGKRGNVPRAWGCGAREFSL